MYIGSADTWLYVIGVDGTLKWKFKCGELIDSAAALGFDPQSGEPTITFGSGDEHLYHLKASPGIETGDDRIIWRFNAKDHPGTGKCDWFEGNVVRGPDGTFYAGNTNYNYYALHPDGALKWVYATSNCAWSAASFDDNGDIYLTSLDLQGRKINGKTGKQLWTKLTLGPVTSSIALGSDGTAYFGSFDNYLYALDPASGKNRWYYQTDDHIYGSPALGVDENGETNAVYTTSSDGALYKFDTRGNLIWKYDTGDTIRSSPVIGRAPEGEEGDIIYFGCANGKLYAVNSLSGTRRWSFDTTAESNELRDRNDLNASPALGNSGIYIGGEHGYIWHIPYDYPLYAVNDPRCETSPLETYPDNFVTMCYSTPGGSTLIDGPDVPLAAATALHARLIVRNDKQTIKAGVYTEPLLGYPAKSVVTFTPSLPDGFTVEPSADARYLHIVPNGFLEPATTYQVSFQGKYFYDGLRFGNVEIGGKNFTDFSDSFSFSTAPAGSDRVPLTVAADEVSAFTMRRLAIPYPSMLPSFNQIGFDSYQWIVGSIELTPPDSRNEGKCLLWAIGGTYNSEGVLVPLKGTEFTFPFNGRYKNDSFIFESNGLKVIISEINISFSVFQVRGQFDRECAIKPGAALYLESTPLNGWYYGPIFGGIGLLNKNMKVVGGGTLLGERYDRRGSANKRPRGITVANVVYTPPVKGWFRNTDGCLEVNLALEAGASYPDKDHIGSIALVDTDTMKAVTLDYRSYTRSLADAGGNMKKIVLTIPGSLAMPRNMAAYVILDVFPLYRYDIP